MRRAVKRYTVLLEFLIALGILPGCVWSVPTRDLVEGYHITGYSWTLSYFLQNYVIVHLNSKKLTKRSRIEVSNSPSMAKASPRLQHLLLFFSYRKLSIVGDIN